jgi:hypothetical protein
MARQVEASRSANKLPTLTSSARPGAYELPLDSSPIRRQKRF